MKDVRRLKDQIARLNAPSPKASADGRDILGSGETDGLAAVLREIEETILPRSLTLTSERGSVVISAGNRRLFSVDAVTGEGLAHVSGVVGLSLTRPDVADLGRLRDTLVAGFGGAKAIFVKSAPVAGDSSKFADGTTAAALASAWGVELSMASTPLPADLGPVAAFIEAIPEIPQAWIQMAAGKTTAEGGAPELTKKLKKFAGSAHMAGLKAVATPEKGRFVAIGRAPGDGNCLILVENDADAALMLLPADKLESAKGIWRESNA